MNDAERRNKNSFDEWESGLDVLQENRKPGYFFFLLNRNSRKVMINRPADPYMT
jgi:hypothetical protein